MTASEVFSGGNLHASRDNVIVQPSRKLQLEPQTVLWLAPCSRALFGTDALFTGLFDTFSSDSAVFLHLLRNFEM